MQAKFIQQERKSIKSIKAEQNASQGKHYVTLLLHIQPTFHLV
jgi:hypothetical protein